MPKLVSFFPTVSVFFLPPSDQHTNQIKCSNWNVSLCYTFIYMRFIIWTAIPCIRRLKCERTSGFSKLLISQYYQVFVFQFKVILTHTYVQWYWPPQPPINIQWYWLTYLPTLSRTLVLNLTPTIMVFTVLWKYRELDTIILLST